MCVYYVFLYVWYMYTLVVILALYSICMCIYSAYLYDVLVMLFLSTRSFIHSCIYTLIHIHIYAYTHTQVDDELDVDVLKATSLHLTDKLLYTHSEIDRLEVENKRFAQDSQGKEEGLRVEIERKVRIMTFWVVY